MTLFGAIQMLFGIMLCGWGLIRNFELKSNSNSELKPRLGFKPPPRTARQVSLLLTFKVEWSGKLVNMLICTLTCDQFNVSLLNKSIIFFKNESY